jgi:hypothetical protein
MRSALLNGYSEIDELQRKPVHFPDVGAAVFPGGGAAVFVSVCVSNTAHSLFSPGPTFTNGSNAAAAGASAPSAIALPAFNASTALSTPTFGFLKEPLT